MTRGERRSPFYIQISGNGSFVCSSFQIPGIATVCTIGPVNRWQSPIRHIAATESDTSTKQLGMYDKRKGQGSLSLLQSILDVTADLFLHGTGYSNSASASPPCRGPGAHTHGITVILQAAHCSPTHHFVIRDHTAVSERRGVHDYLSVSSKSVRD